MLTQRRLRVHVTHRYLLTGDSQPLCDECKSFLTVKHILLECYNLKNICEKYFMCSSLVQECWCNNNRELYQRNQFLSFCIVFVISFAFTLATSLFYLTFLITCLYIIIILCYGIYVIGIFFLQNIQCEWHFIARLCWCVVKELLTPWLTVLTDTGFDGVLRVSAETCTEVLPRLHYPQQSIRANTLHRLG